MNHLSVVNICLIDSYSFLKKTRCMNWQLLTLRFYKIERDLHSL